MTGNYSNLTGKKPGDMALNNGRKGKIKINKIYF
jgi:hypothetical protein